MDVGEEAPVERLLLSGVRNTETTGGGDRGRECPQL